MTYLHLHDLPLCLTAQKKPVTTMLTYPWKCTVLHCNHLGNTSKPLVLMTRHFDYCPSASESDNQSVRSSAPVVSRCFPGGYNVKLYISRGRLAWWLLAFLHSVFSDYADKTAKHTTLNTLRLLMYIQHRYYKYQMWSIYSFTNSHYTQGAKVLRTEHGLVLSCATRG